jgi:glycosyltransferase involved in cell wall biosynthesis
MKALLQVSLARADHTLVLNQEDLSTLREKAKVPASRITNMGGIGVELDKFQPTPVREHASVFALAARLIAEKGVYQYVEAARIVRQQRPNTTFLLLGEVDDNPTSLRADEVTNWVNEGLIEWPGRVNDIQAWLKRCDVFVLPSYYREGVPRSIQEAMALGRAIITTDHVGCRDTVVADVNGYLVEPKNPLQLSGAMLNLIDNKGLAQSMGQSSRHLAEQRFDAKRADQLIIDLLEARTPEE